MNIKELKDKGLIVDECDEHLLLSRTSQNNQNQSVRSDNLVGYKGVSYVLGRGKYRVTIRVNKKRINVGRFDNPHDSARAYNKAATLYHGEFAVLNEIV